MQSALVAGILAVEMDLQIFKGISRCRLVLTAGLIFYLVILVRTAWVCDDAYISFRTVDNFVNGYGLRWNVDERVWTYTNPLWVLLFSGIYAVTREAHVTSIVVSVVLALAGVTIFVRGLSRSAATAALCLSAFIFSKGFVDYSTSGLENVLTHGLLAVFLVIWIKAGSTLRSLFWLSFVAGLVTVNRMDSLILVLPALAYAWWEQRSWRATWLVASGFAPFIIWESFALVYYGFLVPNTYFAKTHVDIAQWELFKQGARYLWESIFRDHVIMPVIITGIISAFLSRNRRQIAIAVGIVLFIFYLLKVGGDFMSSRFLTAPFVCGVALLAMLPLPERGFRRFIPLITLIVLGMTARGAAVFSGQTFGTNGENDKTIIGVADERAWYYQQTGLFRLEQDSIRFSDREWGYRAFVGSLDRDSIIVIGNIGFRGYFAGPQRYIVDECALSDPLLSKLPCDTSNGWRVGHFRRKLPTGYLQTLTSGQNQIEDRSLAEYNDHLQTVVRGKPFTVARFREILAFNTGAYDTLLREYARNLSASAER